MNSFNAASGTWRASTQVVDNGDGVTFQCRKRHLARINLYFQKESSYKGVTFQCRKRHLARINKNPISRRQLQLRFQCRKRHLARINFDIVLDVKNGNESVSMPQAALGAHQLSNNVFIRFSISSFNAASGTWRASTQL